MYKFSIEANNQQAKKSFEELKVLAKEVQDSSSNLRKDPKGEGNLTNTVKTMTEMLNTYSELQKRMDEEVTINFKMNGGQKALDEIKKTRKEIEIETSKIQRTYNDAMHSYKAQTGQEPNFRVARPYEDNSSRYSATRRQADALGQEARDIRNRASKTVRIGNTAMSSRYINHAQASEYQNNSSELLGENYQGGSIDKVRAKLTTGKDFDVDKKSVRGNALSVMEESRLGISERQATIERTKKDKTIKDPLQRDAVIDKNTQEIEDLTKALNNAKAVISSLDDAVKTVGMNNAEVDNFDGKIVQKADRGTLEGRMYERASSIGLAMAGTMAYSVGSAYSEGSSSIKDMRPQSLDVGYATDNNDFRGLRQDLMTQGAEYGNKGTEMLEFTQSILGSAGFKDQESLTAMTQRQMEFAKFSGAGTEASNKYTEGMYKSGAISTADQAKSIQQGFLGAIKMSGMEGREKEQIEALSAINDNLFKGREATEDEVKNRQAMTAILSRTGDKGLQGENLANMMTSLDALVKDASPWSLEGMAMGVGSTPGMSEYDFNLAKEKGMAGDNMDILDAYINMNPDNLEMGAGVLESRLQTGNQEGVKELLELYKKGDLSDEKLKEVQGTLEDTGKSAEDKRSEDYLKSTDALRESFEAFTAQMKTLLSENKAVDTVTKAGKGVSEWGSKGAMRAVLAIGAVSGAKALATGIGSASSLGVVTKAISKMAPTMKSWGAQGGFKGLVGGTFTKGLDVTGKAKSLFGKGGSEVAKEVVEETVTTGKKAGDIASKTTKTATDAKKVKDGATAVDAVGKTANMGKSLLNAGSNLSALEAGSKALVDATSGKAGVLQVGLSAVQIALAEDKKKETTKQAGGLAGGMAGTAMGAMIGSAVPVVGTAIGGLIGGTAGYMGGLNVGEKWDDLSSGWFGGDKGKKKKPAKDPELEVKGAYKEQESLANEQEDVANEQSQYAIEKLRENNISSEAQNMMVAIDLVARIERVLETAKAQNGIVGDASGLNGGSGGGGGVGGELSYTGNSEYWTNTDLTQHDLGKTSNALTADQLDDWINSNTTKGSTMRGMGTAFMDAGKESGLDPRYLVAHSAHETGWGTSDISKDKSNMFGIGAFDDSPYSSAHGYKNPRDGIIKGAKFIADDYYSKGQTTLDKMRNNNGNHEYATDPGWATKIGATMKGSEKFTKPSTVNVTTNVTMSSTGNNKRDGQEIAKEANKYMDYSKITGINKNYMQEHKRI